jgi:hypothetical protein
VKSRPSIHELRHAGATIIGAIRASPLSSDLEDASPRDSIRGTRAAVSEEVKKVRARKMIREL